MTRYQYYRSQREPDVPVYSAARRASEAETAPPCNPDRRPDRAPTAAWGVPGMAYVPDLGFVNLYSPKEALPAGTLFRDLDYPFFGGGKR
jgi:hypothetical protein